MTAVGTSAPPVAGARGQIRRRAMTGLHRAILLFLGVKLAGLIVNVFRFPVLHPAQTSGAGDGSRVSLLIPVRDEAERLPATLNGLLGQRVHEVIFLDDGSTDGTADLLGRAIDGRGGGRGDAGPAIRVLTGATTPAGWAGKTWAMAQLADAATGDLLVFCDADVNLAPAAVDAVVAEMRSQRADAFSVFPRQLTATWGEHLLVPLIDDVLLSFLPFPLLGANVPSAATANGSLFAFTSTAFTALGGFGAVRGAVVEDVAMARHVRAEGYRLGLALGGDLVQTRMYDRWSDLVTGFARGLRPVVGGSRTAVVAGLLAHLAVYTVPVPLLLLGRRRWAWPVGLAVVERMLVEAKTGRRRWAQAGSSPLSPIAAVPVAVRALRREQTWKGRSYA